MKDTFGSRTRKGSVEDLREALDRLAERLRLTSAAAAAVRPRTNLSAALEKISRAAANAVELATLALVRYPALALAISARAVFELYIRTQHIRISEQNLLKWAEEAYIDRIQLYEAILTLPSGSAESRRQIEDEIRQTRERAAGHGLDCSRRVPPVAEIAREAGLSEDYKAFYKFYSKLVHPSSYYVNSPADEVANQANMMVLCLNLQFYGHALMTSVCQVLELDEEKVAPIIRSGPTG